MILKNGKIFNGEKFIKENCVILEGRIIKKICNENELTVKEIENNIREFYYAVIDKKMQKYITVKNDLEDEEKNQKGNE